MSKKSRRHRSHPHERKRKQQQSQPAYDWELPFPPLGPEDRLSTFVDYSDFIPGYDEFVAEMGKEAFEEEMDYFYFFLGHSALLAGQPEFQDVRLGLDPYDFLVYAASDFLIDLVNKKGELFDPAGGYVEPYEHILQHAMRRYLTSRLRADLRHRARRTARRRRGTGIGSIASAVEIALDDEGIPAMVITLLPQLFSTAIVQSVLDQAERFDQDWEERDRSLDRWMEQIAAADFDQPADGAIERLVAAGRRALPQVAHLFYNMDLEYGGYPVDIALEIAARIPSQISLRFLVQALFDDNDWTSVRASELLVGMPELLCPYLAYALTVPGGPDWETALWGYTLLGKAHCPGAFELLVDGLSYQGESPDDAEIGQTSAVEGLLVLGEERAIPILHDYLRDLQADLRTRDELLYLLLEHEGGHPWGAQIAGDLTRDTLPESETEDAT